jgi:murein DD-endopeptidase MepM/ murein hydrolase activator NlpD
VLKKRTTSILKAGLACLLCIGMESGAAMAQQFSAPVEARVPMAPTPVRGSDGRMHLEYELHVTNFYASNGPLYLSELSIFSGSSSMPLATYKAKELADIAKPHPEETTNGVTLPAGSRTVFFLWITLPDGVATPISLSHRMSFQDAKGVKRTLQGVNVALPQRAAITIAPPLRGRRNWLVSEGPGNSHSHHWGSLLALNGVVTIPQRYAIDFVGLNERGHALEVAPDKLQDSANTDWFGYDSEVLAVADGVVRDARDGQPDGKPMSKHGDESDLTARGLYGNLVVLEIAPDVFAHYAHLRPGSLRVRAGQHVHRGEVLARLGDSGNSAAPHLHFHLSNRPTFEESEGVPFRFARFKNEGTAGEDVVLSPSAVWTPHPAQLQESMPLDGDVIEFP